MYSRRINGKTLTLAPSGWTYNDVFVITDRETGSLWYPKRNGLKSIQGAYFGQKLPKIDSEDTVWGDWKMEYPGSLLLK